MKKMRLVVLAILLSLPAAALLAQKNVYQSDAVIATASQLKFRYQDNVKKAAGQNAQAIADLYEFSRILDGEEAIAHARTLLELIPAAGDKAMARAIEPLGAKLKKVCTDRLIKAQSRTEIAALKEPIKSWAPYTWEALHGRPVIFPSEQAANGAPDGALKAGGSLKDADQPAPKPAGGSLQPAKTSDKEGREGGN
ncbi:MAG: hypothetical protein JNK89_07130 [Saprospiraceae bacterium]|nr:hypothetical protein [Saprospiraceae bacterium]